MKFHEKSLLSLLCMCMLLLVCTSFTVARERIALVIGNAHYPQPGFLPNPVNDAEDVAKVLEALNFDVIHVPDGTQNKMRTAIQSFGEKLSKAKVAVFYYSGHGVENEGTNYLIPVNTFSEIAVAGHLSELCISLNYVVQLMAGTGSAINIVMVDACRNNPFPNINNKTIGSNKGLASFSGKARNTLIFYAASPGEIAQSGSGRNSPYTKRLLELIGEPNMPVEMMFKEIVVKVNEDTKFTQNPWTEGSLGKQFYFNPVQVNDNSTLLSAKPAIVTSAISASALGVAGMLEGKFVQIRGGEFTMGSPAGEAGHQKDETQHQVKVSDFYMSKYELTVREFRKFIEDSGYKTDAEKGDGSYVWEGKEWKKQAGINWRHGVSGSVRPQSEENHPVVHVSWNDAVAYCEWLSKTTGNRYRLPTEEEWEYACRAGTTTPFNTGSNLTTEQANYSGNYPYNNNAKGQYRQNTVPVESFAPNAWGLYNMHGNVWEWTDSLYDKSGSLRVIRGGSWLLSLIHI